MADSVSDGMVADGVRQSAMWSETPQYACGKTHSRFTVRLTPVAE
ncbi:hypothetical protein [Acetobacter sp. AN02]|nr:hypothetical protein [Acetobacter sp. AN02]